MARTKYHYYEFGNKTSKLLTWQNKMEDSEKYIHCIKTEEGRCLEEPKKLSKLSFPKIDIIDKDFLDAGISDEEVLCAINSLQNNKAPGPDEFPTEYFKTFSKKFLAPLTNMIKETLDKQVLPQSLEVATITLLPKPGKK